MIQPNHVNIPAGAQSVMLNISAKLKDSYQIEKQKQQELPIARAFSFNVPPTPRKDGSAAIQRCYSEKENEEQHRKRMLATNIEKYNHLLIAKVRDSQFIFSFIIEASIIDNEPTIS